MRLGGGLVGAVGIEPTSFSRVKERQLWGRNRRARALAGGSLSK